MNVHICCMRSVYGIYCTPYKHTHTEKKDPFKAFVNDVMCVCVLSGERVRVVIKTNFRHQSRCKFSHITCIFRIYYSILCTLIIMCAVIYMLFLSLSEMCSSTSSIIHIIHTCSMLYASHSVRNAEKDQEENANTLARVN